jgi:hypothetical protein
MMDIFISFIFENYDLSLFYTLNGVIFYLNLGENEKNSGSDFMRLHIFIGAVFIRKVCFSFEVI